MKKINNILFWVIACLFIALPFDGTGQSAYVNNYQQSPQSPEASEFSNYTSVPVSTYTGVPNINVPLCALESDFLSIPVGMSYHGGGIRVNDIAGWTGQGWSLNVGGIITREVKDQPDDAKQVNTDVTWCSDPIACRNCVECDADPEACESCPDGSYTKVINQTYDSVGYLFRGQQVHDLIDRDWNTFTPEEEEVVWGNPNDYFERLTFDELDLENDIIVDIDVNSDGPTSTCCAIYNFILFNELLLSGDIFALVVNFNPSIASMQWNQINIALNEANDYSVLCNGEILPVMSLDHVLEHYSDFLDCIRFDVMRPKYDFIDTEPDIFSFNVNGHSGKFIFDKNGLPRQFEESDLKIDYTLDCYDSIPIPRGNGGLITRNRMDYNSIYTGAITEFKITDTDGIMYIFRDKDISFGNDENQAVPPGSQSFYHHDNTPKLKDPYRIDFENVNATYSSWHLSEIRVPQKLPEDNLEYRFSYDDELTVDHSFISMTGNLCQSSGQPYSYNSSVNTIFKKRLSSIEWKKGGSFNNNYVLDFMADTSRLDYYYPPDLLSEMGHSDIARRLDKIEYRIGEHIFKDIDFNYVYYDKKTIGSFDPVEKPWMESHRSRLKLNSIQMGGYAENGSYEEQPSYMFDYNSEPLPPRHSCEKDFWGFYNGTSQSFLPHIWAYPLNSPPLSNELNIGPVQDYWHRFNTPYSIYQRWGPTTGVSEYDLSLSYIHGDREVYENFAKAGILEKITHPTSGHTDFVFESNTFGSSQFQNPNLPPKKAGGLRIQSISNSEGVNIAYEYFRGSLTDLPLFARSVDVLTDCNTSNSPPYNSTIISSESFAGIGLTEGSPVGYGYVYEIFNDSSRTEYHYEEPFFTLGNRVPATFPNNYQYDSGFAMLECGVDFAGKHLFDFPDFFHTIEQVNEDYYPFPPKPNYDWKRKKLRKKIDKDDSGNVVRLEDYEYVLRCAEEIHGIKSLQNISAEAQLFGLFRISSAKYNYLTTDYKLSKITSSLDGVTSETDFTYDSNFEHHFVKTEQTVNSDGKLHIKEYLFPYDPEYNTNYIYPIMIDQNRIKPLGYTKSTNGNMYAGEKSYYEYFNEYGAPLEKGPHLLRTETYDLASDGTSSWANKMTIGEVDLVIGKVKSMHVEGWEDETFTYDDVGQIDTTVFGGFTTVYDYYPNTKLLKSIIDIDGQVTDFEYDGLHRLTKKSERNGNVTTDIDYGYTPNFVEVTQNFGSDVQLVTKEKYDGLGRKKETIKIDYQQGGGAVTTETLYNTKGQIWKEIDLTGFATIYSYYNNPLNRVKTITDPMGNVTTKNYGTNANEHPDYTAGLLFKEETVDPDGLASTTFIDKLGRSLLSKHSDSSNEAKTYMEYDDKGRLELVIPPDATENDEGLIYRYTYAGDDAVLTKQLPDRGVTEFAYDLRNLQIGMKDPLLTAKGKDWLVTVYDAHGRQEKLGFGTISEYFPTVDETLIHNFYDGTGTNQTDTIYNGKLDKSIVNILDGYEKGASDITKTYTLDAYGRNNNIDISNSTTGNESYAYSYDMADNILTTTHQSPATTPTLTNSYDLQGRLMDRKLEVDGVEQEIVGDIVYLKDDLITSKSLRNGQESISYSYNANRWLMQILANKNISPYGECYGTDPTPLFKMFYYYHLINSGITNIPRYNGTISSISETQAGIGYTSYVYEYDFLNRLTSSTSTAGNSTGSSYTYHDKRGNIGTIKRNGFLKDGDCYTSALIDDLQLEYIPGTNQLKSINEFSPLDECPENYNLGVVNQDGDYGVHNLLTGNGVVNANNQVHFTSENKIELRSGFEFNSDGTGLFTASNDDCPENNELTQANFTGFQPGGTDDYAYDDNGNIIFEPNKELHIKYNFLNLPYEVSKGQDNIKWTYAADGTKIRKTVTANGSSTIKDYFGEIEKSGSEYEVHHSEGKVVNDGSTQKWQYFLKDHLGSTRVIYEQDNDGDGEVDIVQNNMYYPFGMKMNGPWNDQQTTPNDYTYNGKEDNKELGLNWMNYGARMYDPAIGRFTGVDPISDQFAHVSTYNYAENKVPNGIDLWGLQFVSANDAKIYFHGSGASLKIENLSNPTSTRINQAQPISGRTSNGGTYIGTSFDQSAGSFDVSMPSKQGTINRYISKSRPGGGNSKQRRKWVRSIVRKGFAPRGTFSRPIPTGGRGGKGIPLVWLFIVGSEAGAQNTVENDLNSAYGQFNNYAEPILDIIDNGLNQGIIPTELQSDAMLGDLANYIFQGVFQNKYDESTFQNMRETAQTLINESGTKLDCERCQDKQE